jgi:hypothetical protein
VKEEKAELQAAVVNAYSSKYYTITEFDEVLVCIKEWSTEFDNCQDTQDQSYAFVCVLSKKNSNITRKMVLQFRD